MYEHWVCSNESYWEFTVFSYKFNHRSFLKVSEIYKPVAWTFTEHVILKTLQALNWYWASTFAAYTHFLLVVFMLRWISYCHIGTVQFSWVLVQEIGFPSQMLLTVLCINIDQCSYIIWKGVSMTFLEAGFLTCFFVCMYVGFCPPVQSEVIPQNSMFDVV